MALILQELEYGDSGLRSFVSVQGSLSMYAIYRFGSEAQKQHWLPRMASGEVIGCFGLTEPDSGSDPGSMRTMARQDGDAYVLNGAKMWITNAPICHVAVVWAKLEEDDPKDCTWLCSGARYPRVRDQDNPQEDVPARLTYGRDLSSLTAVSPKKICCRPHAAWGRR